MANLGQSWSNAVSFLPTSNVARTGHALLNLVRIPVVGTILKQLWATWGLLLDNLGPLFLVIAFFLPWRHQGRRHHIARPLDLVRPVNSGVNLGQARATRNPRAWTGAGCGSRPSTRVLHGCGCLLCGFSCKSAIHGGAADFRPEVGGRPKIGPNIGAPTLYAPRFAATSR